MTRHPDVLDRGVGFLQFDRVVKRFSSDPDVHRKAVDDVSLTIRPGEAVGIIGPNGAGKSTLLKLAAGVSAPTSGAIRRRGRTSAVIELGAGMHPDLTGRENVLMAGGLAGLSRRELRDSLSQTIEFAGLARVIDHPIRTYSTGMVARLAFAVSTSARPDLLLIDEVLSVGDIDFQRRCQDRIDQLRASGTTVVLVSHDLELVGDMCERVVLLVDGVVQEDGRADTVIRRYLGLPEPPVEVGLLTLTASQDAVEMGMPLRVHLGEVPPGSTAARVDLVIRHHPVFLAVGEDLSVTFASAVIPGPPPGVDVSLTIPTTGLPPGRYELRVAMEAADGTALAIEEIPVRVSGPIGPIAIRLGGSGTIDGRELTGSTDVGAKR